MAFAQGSRSRLSYIKEVTYATTPAGNFTQIPYTTHSLDLSKQRVQGNDIQSDRMPRNDRHGNRAVGGDIVADMRNIVFDALLESVMFNAWTNNTGTPDNIKVGTTVKSLSIEDYAADIDQSKVYTGCVVSQAAFSIKPNQMVQSTFSIVGSNLVLSTTEKTVTVPATQLPFDAYSGSLTLGNTGGALSSVASITGIDFSINNNVGPTYVIGSASTPQLEYGLAAVEGTITAYWEDATLINRFINETESAFKVTVGDGTNVYSFTFPRVKFNGAATPVGGPTSRVVTIPFVSLFDTTTSSNLTIERPEANT